MVAVWPTRTIILQPQKNDELTLTRCKEEGVEGEEGEEAYDWRRKGNNTTSYIQSVSD